ncbi:MAG: DUF4340 domain-containing protein [Verrucomicrobiaceae bacterium]|nr:MAG: DUF4340 domain-containing protein [Verrucomicrobiaceae bacterium]
MRSLGFTVALGLAAALLGFVAAWQWRLGNFDALLGTPPVAVGQRVYDSFTPAEVKHIRVSSGGASAGFSLRENGWQAATPWEDRMDPRAAVAIINFTLAMRVEDLAEADDVDPSAAGLEDGSVKIRLEDADRRPLANYRLGRVSPWKAEVDGAEQAVATVFIQPRDRHRKRHVYLCAGDINPLFKDGLKFLRDHRPFYFNPVSLGKIRIRSQQGDLTLGRETPQSPWRIVKPLDLPTDPAAMKKLLEGLFELQAIRVSDRAAASPPAEDAAVKPAQIAITTFGSEVETVLEIYPPESPENQEVRATVSDRPNTRFELPLKPEPGIVSLADLPLAINDLRDPTLTRLNVASLRTISIQPATGAEILISREPPQPWMTTIDGIPCEANEENLFALLKAVTSSRATGFESDAATDFTPWGLDRPVLTLRFLSRDNQVLELRFGLDSRGGLFVNRAGTATVMRVDESFLASIPVRPYEWRHSRLWSVDRVNLLGIMRVDDGGPPLVLKYQFNQESWQAGQEGKDLTPRLDPARANFMLSVLEGLKVSRWLAANDEQALAALAKPSLSLTVTEFTTDDEGETAGIMDRTVVFAPAGTPGFFFGRLGEDPHPFLLDAETYGKLAAGLLER